MCELAKTEFSRDISAVSLSFAFRTDEVLTKLCYSVRVSLLLYSKALKTKLRKFPIHKPI